MIEKFADIKGQLSELATVLNKFNSEAVQLRLLDVVFGKDEGTGEPRSEESSTTAHKSTRRKSHKAKKEVEAQPEKRKKVTLGSGARATLTQLLETPLFNKAQTINSIIEHCKHNLARTFKPNEFSGSLARMVRSGELTRKKNADHQYEYKKP
jgi:hypothetical protein